MNAAAAPLPPGPRPATLEETLPPQGFFKRLEKRLRRPAMRKLRTKAAGTKIANEPWGTFAPGAKGERLIRAARSAPILRSTVRAHVTLQLGERTGGPVDAHYAGYPIRFYPARSESARLMLLAPDRYQAEEFAFLAAHGDREGLFLDIGANAGAYSFWAAREGWDVLAFEPDPFMHDTLMANILMARAGTPGAPVAIDLLRTALDDKAEAGAFSQRVQSLVAGTDDMVEVATNLLHIVLDERDVRAVGAVKIDVEGAEDRVLIPFFREAPAALHPRAILIEHVASPLWKEDVMQVLSDHGYRPVFRNAHNTGLVRPVDHAKD
ncbi:MAG: FkbM family methyltransferase [Pseudomonadota bacterium]